jgi:putative hemolysin
MSFNNIVNYRNIIFLLPAAASPTPLPIPHVRRGTTSSAKLYAEHQKHLMQVISATCSAVSVAASIVAFYWFCRMRKHFRHKFVFLSQYTDWYWGADESDNNRLIMVLLYGNLMKATWYFIFAVVSMARGMINTESSFCQASGFLVQYGTETSGQF